MEFILILIAWLAVDSAMTDDMDVGAKESHRTITQIHNARLSSQQINKQKNTHIEVLQACVYSKNIYGYYTTNLTDEVCEEGSQQLRKENTGRS